MRATQNVREGEEPQEQKRHTWNSFAEKRLQEPVSLFQNLGGDPFSQLKREAGASRKRRKGKDEGGGEPSLKYEGGEGEASNPTAEIPFPPFLFPPFLFRSEPTEKYFHF